MRASRGFNRPAGDVVVCGALLVGAAFGLGVATSGPLASQTPVAARTADVAALSTWGAVEARRPGPPAPAMFTTEQRVEAFRERVEQLPPRRRLARTGPARSVARA